jgi:hypothetical protein
MEHALTSGMIGIFATTSLLFQLEASLDYIHEARVWKDTACALRRKLSSDVGIQTGEAH